MHYLPDDANPKVAITAVPDAERSRLKLSPFYSKYASANGLPVVSSARVSDAGLIEAVRIVSAMLAPRDDIRLALIKNNIRVVVMSVTEQLTDIPEHSDLKPKSYWDARARGLGATKARPAISCGEENLLSQPGDRYPKENILVHEFAHTMHEMGINSFDKNFEPALKLHYESAKRQGLWKDTYAMTNFVEYWAEGVQSYFDCNDVDRTRGLPATREQLAIYDPMLFALIDETFRKTAWRYRKPSQRSD